VVTSKSIKLFHQVAKDVPAYKKFLAKHDITPESITSVDDFTRLPITNKKTYLVPSPRNELMSAETLAGPMWVCSTSGSTGEPYYFPRVDELAARGSWFVEDFVRNSSYGHGRTLVIMGFGMGVWIGGVITLRSFEIAAQRHNLPLSFLPTGYNKTEVFKALKKLSPDYDQTILVGYPPFVKEVVDEASGEGINLKKLNMRLVFAAESFTETFRNYVCKKAGIKNPILDTLNIYGSADIGAMANETPLSILVRQLLLEDPLLYREIFGQIEKTPTVAQYNPDFIEFEDVEGELVLTSSGAMPLVRYAIGDHGGLFDYAHLKSTMARYKIDLDAEIHKAGLEGKVNKSRPFVYVYERTDLSASLHGIIIYPEFIKEALLHPSMNTMFTERFTMSTKHDIHHNQFILINVELRKDIEESEEIKLAVQDAIRKNLIQKSSEFSEVSKSRAAESLIQVALWPNGHPRYFKPGTKQTWVEQNVISKK
jgi:phenylacetate-CoA ligase